MPHAVALTLKSPVTEAVSITIIVFIPLTGETLRPYEARDSLGGAGTPPAPGAAMRSGTDDADGLGVRAAADLSGGGPASP